VCGTFDFLLIQVVFKYTMIIKKTISYLNNSTFSFSLERAISMYIIEISTDWPNGREKKEGEREREREREKTTKKKETEDDDH